MTEIDLSLPADWSDLQACEAIQSALERAGLTITLRGTLRKYEGCTHWHAKPGKQKGTLEATYWPAEHRAWLSIQRGRQAAWIDAAIAHVRAFLPPPL